VFDKLETEVTMTVTILNREYTLDELTTLELLAAYAVADETRKHEIIREVVRRTNCTNEKGN
jgi:hypothetical protein